MEHTFNDIAPASTTSLPTTGKITRLRRPQKAGRRKASPLLAAKHYGEHCTVTLTLRLTRGSRAWIEVVAPTGKFFIPIDAGVWNLMRQLIRGGHWVE